MALTKAQNGLGRLCLRCEWFSWKGYAGQLAAIIPESVADPYLEAPKVCSRREIADCVRVPSLLVGQIRRVFSSSRLGPLANCAISLDRQNRSCSRPVMKRRQIIHQHVALIGASHGLGADRSLRRPRAIDDCASLRFLKMPTRARSSQKP